ncbi:hypothetical protein Tco_0121211 [Tanacetum coccineum]
MCTHLKNMEGYKPQNLKNKSFDAIQKLFDIAYKRINTFEDFRTKLVEGSEKRAGEELMQEVVKKQKVNDDQEAAKMKDLMGKKLLLMKRTDGSQRGYSALYSYLDKFCREDLKPVKNIKAKHGSTRPEEGYERMLWGDLKTMFEPNVEDTGRIVGIKRLLDDLRVTAAQVCDTAAKLKLVLFINFNEKYVK